MEQKVQKEGFNPIAVELSDDEVAEELKRILPANEYKYREQLQAA